MENEYEKLHELRDKIQKLLEEYPNIGMFFIIMDHSFDDLPCVIGGDECPICSINDLIKWAMENNIQHKQNDKKERVH